MRLYTNDQGDWVGTQAEARKQFGKKRRTVEVPTDKTNLMAYLNLNRVGAVQATPSAEPTPELLSPHAQSWVGWALSKLNRGEKDEAIKMLRKGLSIQSAWVEGDKKDSGWVR